MSMTAVILMAGKGKRWVKHYKGPKQLMPVHGKPIVEYLLDSLPDEIDKFIFVVGGPHEERIRSHFASGEYGGRPITFVVQEEQLGLAHAFKTARSELSGRWFGAVADDIVDPKGLKKLFNHDLAILAYRVRNPEMFGVLVPDREGNLQKAIEKPKEFISDLVWTGHMVMDESFFEVDVKPSDRGEYETPDVWTKLIKEQGKKIKIVEAKLWLPINDRDQLEEAERALGANN